jgi:enoyl-[acyl-carrier-protein] reductase (NADH)
MATRAAAANHPASELVDKAVAATALGRLPTEEDVANTVLFLASDLAGAITGALVPITAGAR